MNGFRLNQDDQPDHVFGPDSAADAVLSEEFGQRGQSNNYEITEVVRRIEMAKLYQTLLTHPLFSRGTADDSLIEHVEREARGFFYERLQVLVGINKDTQNKPETSVFTKEEVEHLKSLASRMIQKSASAENSQPQAAQPVMNTLTIKPDAPLRPAQPKNQRRSVQKTEVNQAAEAPLLIDELPESNPRYAKPQAVSKTIKPKPMPRQAQMDNLNAQTVQAAAEAAAPGVGSMANIVSNFTK
jgi:hypothetical protein